jgi:hypothetical protein
MCIPGNPHVAVKLFRDDICISHAFNRLPDSDSERRGHHNKAQGEVHPDANMFDFTCGGRE